MIAFIKDSANPPTSVGKVSVTFSTLDGVSPTEATCSFSLLDVKNKVVNVKSVELSQYMSLAQLNAVNNFMTQLRTKITVEII